MSYHGLYDADNLWCITPDDASSLEEHSDGYEDKSECIACDRVVYYEDYEVCGGCEGVLCHETCCKYECAWCKDDEMCRLAGPVTCEACVASCELCKADGIFETYHKCCLQHHINRCTEKSRTEAAYDLWEMRRERIEDSLRRANSEMKEAQTKIPLLVAKLNEAQKMALPISSTIETSLTKEQARIFRRAELDLNISKEQLVTFRNKITSLAIKLGEAQKRKAESKAKLWKIEFASFQVAAPVEDGSKLTTKANSKASYQVSDGPFCQGTNSFQDQNISQVMRSNAEISNCSDSSNQGATHLNKAEVKTKTISDKNDHCVSPSAFFTKLEEPNNKSKCQRVYATVKSLELATDSMKENFQNARIERSCYGK